VDYGSAEGDLSGAGASSNRAEDYTDGRADSSRYRGYQSLFDLVAPVGKWRGIIQRHRPVLEDHIFQDRKDQGATKD